MTHKIISQKEFNRKLEELYADKLTFSEKIIHEIEAPITLVMASLSSLFRSKAQKQRYRDASEDGTLGYYKQGKVKCFDAATLALRAEEDMRHTPFPKLTGKTWELAQEAAAECQDLSAARAEMKPTRIRLFG